MKKISIIAASFLTAAVVFSGCGGGGSSSTTAPVVKTKNVTVSDGYVYGATVYCVDANGVMLTPAASPNGQKGGYTIEYTGECPFVKSEGGIDDINDNGVLEAGVDLKAITMAAPGEYNNINPLTSLLVLGLTKNEIETLFGIPASTNYDTDTLTLANNGLAGKLAAVVVTLANTQGVARGVLPGITPEDISRLKQAAQENKTIVDVLQADDPALAAKIQEVEIAQNYEEYAQKLSTVIAPANDADVAAAQSKESSSSSSVMSSSSEASSGGTCLPGQDCTAASSQSSTSSTQASSSSSAATAGNCLPGQDCTAASSQSSTSSTQASSSSSAVTAGDCLPGQDCTAASSQSSTSSTQVSSSSSAATAGDCLPGTVCS